MLTDIIQSRQPGIRREHRATLNVLITGLVLVLAGCGSSSGVAGQPVSSTRTSVSTARPQTPTAAPSPSHLAALPVAPGAGRLAQTTTRPMAHGPAFHAMVTDLWLAVSRDQPSLARSAFFPVDAYKQVKAIYDPAGDWRSRLWLDFTVDVRAAHNLFGADAKAAKLIRVIVPSAGAAWIGPGVCYNRVGYWHVANPRVVYRLHHQIRSFGIASLISWRGVWYVMHFGGITRPAVGMVDAPAIGPGYAGPQGGC